MQFEGNESVIRKMMKSLFGNKLYWIEQARGGSVGFPDALVPNEQDLLLPVELKWMVAGKAKIRPAQIRFHVVSAAQGRKSALIFGSFDPQGNLIAFVVAGINCPRDGKVPEAIRFYFKTKEDLWQIFKDDCFWCGDKNEQSGRS